MSITYHSLAKMIDHSLLHPVMTDTILKKECAVAVKYDVASVCIKPYAVPLAVDALRGSTVMVGTVIGFPHGNSQKDVKVFEAMKAIEAGAVEIDMVINIGKALAGDWDYVKDEIKAVNDAVLNGNAILKVIFENDFQGEKEIIRLCKICTEVGTAFVKTSTGYGFVKQDNGMYSYNGATVPHLKLMRKHSAPKIQVKAAGGIRTLKDLLLVQSLNVSRVGATATAQILDEARIHLDAGVNLSGLINNVENLGNGY